MRVPRWGKWSIAVAGLALVLALALPAVLDTERYRPMLVQAIEDATGRTATIGRIRARFLPTIGFTIEDVTLEGPGGFGGPPFVSIGSIRGKLAVLPLLRSRYELSGIEITKPRVHLIEDADNRANYTFAAASARPIAATIAGLDSLVIRDAEIVVGRLVGQTRVLTETVRIAGVTAEMADLTFAEVSIEKWRGRANLAGTRLEVPGFVPVAIESGALTFTGGGLAADFVTALSQVATVTGRVRIVDLRRAVAEFSLTIPHLDLDRLAAVMADSPPGPAGDAPVYRAGSAVLLLAEGQVTIDRVRFAGLDAGPARLTIRTFTDRVEFDPVTIDAYGGSASLTATLDQRVAPASLTATLTVGDVQLGPVLTALNATEEVTGTAHVSLQLTGPASTHATDAWTGDGRLDVKDGIVPGFGRDGVMSKIARLQHAISFGAAGSPQEQAIPYRLFAADLRVAAGRVHSPRVRLESDAGALTMRGSVGLDGSLRYDGTAVLRGGHPAREGVLNAVKGLIGTAVSQTLGRVRIPFSIRGTFMEPVVNPG